MHRRCFAEVNSSSASNVSAWDVDVLRTKFSLALSEMYRQEVPLYGDLIQIVRDVDTAVLRAEGQRPEDLPLRNHLERHGAIRLGSEEELQVIKRLFVIFGMHPVGYYDLQVVNFPLHATAFRPITEESLAKNPFRVFTSVLRKDLLSPAIRDIVEQVLSKRNLFSARLLDIIHQFESGGTFLTASEADELITESLKVFKWHSRSMVTIEDYNKLKQEHPLVADIVCFPSAHINHLTPRTLDIEYVQKEMIRRNLPAKERIEGPPIRRCPILLRQTSFKALDELVNFPTSTGDAVPGTHTARFGEVEQRGAAVTRKGRDLYDELLNTASEQSSGSSRITLDEALVNAFRAYPDTWRELQEKGLVYFRYRTSSSAHDQELRRRLIGKLHGPVPLGELIKVGLVEYDPLTYEDFLPLQASSPDHEEHAVDVVTEEYPDQWETTFPSGESGIDQALGASAPVEKSGHGFSPSELQRLEELKRPIRQMIDQDENSNEDLLAVTPNQTLSSSGTEAHCTCESVVHQTQWFLPLRRVADSLMSTYFSKIHRIYPVLHQGSFRALYDRLWESAGSNSEQKVVNCSGLCKQRKRGLLYAAVLHAVFALASLFEPGCPRRNATRADEFFSRTQDLNFLDVLGDEVDTGLVQLGVLMGFYLQATERFSKCWNVTSLTIGLAQTMGLHLADAQAKKRGFITTPLTQMDYEMRSRVWYGCVVLEREVTMCFGRQIMGPNVGKGPRLPEPIDDDRLSQVVGQWNIQPREQPSLLESYIQTIKLYDILNKVTTRKEPHSLPSPPSTDCQQSTATTNFQNILDLDALLMEWRKALPGYLHYEPGSSESSCLENSSSDGLPILRDHLYYQAKRLYLRFLHVRMLILRPALDLLFEKQQTEPVVRKGPLEVSVEDLVVSSIASQCVLSAQGLASFLEDETQSKGCQAWWYNVRYLHCSASIMLLAQLCNFGDGSSFRQSPKALLEQCLKCLSNYKELSSVARKSIKLLKDAYESLSRSGQPPAERRDKATNTRHPDSQSQSHLSNVNAMMDRSGGVSQPGTEPILHDGSFGQGSLAETSNNSQDQDIRLTGSDGTLADPAADHFLGLDDEFWSLNHGDMLQWPLVPFICQFESLPDTTDPQDLK
ncbi:hypothetical protein AU210_005442 [Fusarium oxysporum f. sp. radicis-cucumerinum]|uniref:2-oxoadipate dioxygenase/decarboxylase n=1 Tax=Fusarium oxysporum f. sp. radicis-cucumerinum TaxID=327505 RepID=A0A2H3HR69_FUSOX|nr:hypothetical protein AU210_005442 [Fusarium oxysporum f. sp. radicis-cucumerinum]